ncbi:MAG: hypothetical protein ACI4VF_03460 [Lachnospirales bacterium]
MKKKVLSIFIAAVLTLSAVGCSSNSSVQVSLDTNSVNVGDNQSIVENALGSEVWSDHLENDLMKFWNNPDAKDLSGGLFNTFLSNKGEKLPEDESQFPEEIKAALENDEVKDLITTDTDYVRAHSRLTYAYGVAYHITGKTEYLEMCKKGTMALQQAFDNNNGMYITKNKTTGQWDTDRNARTSQDLAYGITGMGMYYYLTHDESVLNSIINAKDYIFNTYFDENKGYITWLPKDTEDNQTQIVAQLDQLYAYMLMLTPSLPEPYQSEWKTDMKKITDILINRFYSQKNNLFWGVVNNTESMQLGTGHTDFGHSVKTLWVIMKVGQILDEPSYVDFAKPKIDAILKEAYIEEDGSWARRFNSDGSIDKDKEWWIFAELDQAAEIMAINDPSYYEYLNNTQKYWLDTMVDHENGEIWHMVDANGNPVISYPKAHCWKTSLHSFEHALFSYMTAAQLKGENFDVYYAFSENENVTENGVKPYMFSANTVSISKGDKIDNIQKGNCIYKVTFNQLY